jgi:ATP-dependent DNA ligase
MAKRVSDFPSLWDISLTGKCKVWRIDVFDAEGHGLIRTEYGYEDGKKTVNEKVVSVGKNIGKKNETTPVQQALVEARAVWSKKKDAGYRESAGAAGGAAGGAGAGVGAGAGAVEAASVASATVAASRAKAISTDVPLPMLAHDYHKRGKDIKFPCFVQPKLDGTRCVAVCGSDGGLFSRNRKKYHNLNHIKAVVASLPEGLILDGELYSDELSFQEIVGLVKSEKLKADQVAKEPKIQLWVYDIIDASTGFGDRYKRLQTLFAGLGAGSPLRLVETVECKASGEVKGHHDRYVEGGFEGVMLRNVTGKYDIGHRSKELQKYKLFETEEFEVVGFAEGDGVEKGCVIWRCKTEDGKEFACRPQGSHEERRALLAEAASYIGQKLTVKFQELTTDLIPRFPVGLAFRTYE